jgi:hypothetical protein
MAVRQGLVRSLLALALVANLAAAEPLKLRGVTIVALLKGNTLVYEDGYKQSFEDEGATTFDGGKVPSKGRWRVTGDQYCSNWPPSDSWDCYDVTLWGGAISFIAADGSARIGRFFFENPTDTGQY